MDLVDQSLLSSKAVQYIKLKLPLKLLIPLANLDLGV